MPYMGLFIEVNVQIVYERRNKCGGMYCIDDT